MNAFHFDPYNISLSPPIPELVVPPQALVLPLFQLDETFDSCPSSSYVMPMPPATTTRGRSGGQQFDGAAPPLFPLSESSDTPTSEQGDRLSPSHPIKPVVVRDAAAAGPVTLDLEAHPDLNKAPPNWGAYDPDHGGHVHCPWRHVLPLASSSLTGLEELLLALRAEMQHDETPAAESQAFPAIVAGAEDLKALLMAPFTSSPMTLLVHRIGDSLLLEGATRFDLPGSSTSSASDTRRRTLSSKLLYYSILAQTEVPVPLFDHHAPPAEHQSSPPPCFRRTLRWRFDDLSVLLGSKAPLVRSMGPDGKDMTLQVHDARQYIKQVQALEYWLDNILNSIGHVALCFHIDGVVQGYRVIPTDDLPDIGEVPFSPIAVQQHASNVLRWLRTACHKEGGSYVLVKERDSQELKLYGIDELHKYRDAAIANSMRLTGRSAAVLKPEARPAEERLSPSPRSTVPRLNAAPLDSIDDQVPPSSLSQAGDDLLAAARREFAVAFDQPIAVMCFRMAQCLPSTDAEALRLYLRAISLFPADGEVTHALLRASAHAHAAEYHASSGLAVADESDWASRYHARGALLNLTIVLCATDTAAFIPLEPDVSPYRSAVKTAAWLMRLFCGVASRQCAEKRFRDAIASLALVQGFMLHFAESVPAGLLHDRPGPVAESAASAHTASRLPAAVPASPDSHELLAVIASMESILGEIFTMVLEQLGPDEARASVVAPGVPSPLRDALQMQQQAVRELRVAAEHEMTEVTTIVYRGEKTHVVARGGFIPPLQLSEALDVMPEHISPLRRIRDVEPTTCDIFDAVLAFFLLAKAHSGLAAPASSARTISEFDRKISRAYAIRAASFSARVASIEARIHEQQEFAPASATPVSAPHHHHRHLREQSDAALEQASRAYEDAMVYSVRCGNVMEGMKMARSLALCRLKTAERVAESVGAYSSAEQVHLDAAAACLRAVLDIDDAHRVEQHHTAHHGVSKEALQECTAAAEAALADVYLISASRYATILNQQPPGGLRSLDDAALDEGVGATTRISVLAAETKLIDGFILSAIRAAKKSHRAAVELRCLDFLADTRRLFAAVEPLDAVPGMRPVTCSPQIMALLASRPASERIERLQAAATTVQTALTHHATTLSSPTFVSRHLVAVDLQIALLKLLPMSCWDERVTAIERAIGALHSTRTYLRHQLAEAATGKTSDSSRRELQSMGRQLSQRLADVLLTVLKMQQAQQGTRGTLRPAPTTTAAHGNVKNLCAAALKASHTADTDTAEALNTTSSVALVLATLDALPNVFRSFADTKRRRSQ